MRNGHPLRAVSPAPKTELDRIRALDPEPGLVALAEYLKRGEASLVAARELRDRHIAVLRGRGVTRKTCAELSGTSDGHVKRVAPVKEVTAVETTADK